MGPGDGAVGGCATHWARGHGGRGAAAGRKTGPVLVVGQNAATVGPEEGAAGGRPTYYWARTLGHWCLSATRRKTGALLVWGRNGAAVGLVNLQGSRPLLRARAR